MGNPAHIPSSKSRNMNRYFTKAFIAVCGFCVPIIMIGKLWALAPFLLAVFGILYYSCFNRVPKEEGKK